MKLLIVAGGGGHFVSALAVIQQLPKEWEIVVVGRKYAFEGDSALSLEYQTCQQQEIPFIALETGRLQRKFSFKSIASLFKLPKGLLHASNIIRDYKPDVVISFGGYVSVPIVLVSALKHIPLVIHEQTHKAGLANSFAAKFAQKICISWEDARRFFPLDKTVLTGNPLRKEFLSAEAFRPIHPAHAKIKKVLENLPKGVLSDAKTTEPLLYITGGSAGAHAINLLIEGCLSELLMQYTIIHQTGDAQEYQDYDRLHKLKATLDERLQKRYHIYKFIDTEKVADILIKADLVISRAGINTVGELLYLGKPALFIPLLYGQHQEQLTNALFVKQIGLAEVVNQNEMTPSLLKTQIETMIQQLENYRQHADFARNLIKSDAAERIISVINEVYVPKKNKTSALIA